MKIESVKDLENMPDLIGYVITKASIVETKVDATLILHLEKENLKGFKKELDMIISPSGITFAEGE
jgi:hypothetical protein